jgi:hypothetical protein
MPKLHQRLSAPRPGHEREALQRQIDATDAQIDRLVYDLYGLTASLTRSTAPAETHHSDGLLRSLCLLL